MSIYVTVTVNLESPGLYVSTAGVIPRLKLVPDGGGVRVKGMVQGWTYEIKNEVI